MPGNFPGKTLWEGNIMLNTEEIFFLKQKSAQIRKTIIEMLYQAGSGHTGGSLSLVEILVYLYFKEIKINMEKPKSTERNMLILSKGHGCPALYTVLAEIGLFNKDVLKTYKKLNSILQGHPDRLKTPGIDMSTGSLGQGLSVGIGCALADKIKGDNHKTYVILGDGELQEGQIWEAAIFASRNDLDNLCVFIDNNKLQLTSKVEEIFGKRNLSLIWKDFGWESIEIDGHDFDEIDSAVLYPTKKPKIVIANTIKGKGISFMENKIEWHSKKISEDDYKKALNELLI
jgi:transketolase